MSYHDDLRSSARARYRRDQWKRDQALAESFGATLGIYDDDPDEDAPDEDEPYGFDDPDEDGASYDDFADLIRLIQ